MYGAARKRGTLISMKFCEALDADELSYPGRLGMVEQHRARCRNALPSGDRALSGGTLDARVQTGVSRT